MAGSGLDLGACEAQGRGNALPEISSVIRTAKSVQLRLPLSVVPAIGIQYSPDMSPGSWIDLGNFSYAQDSPEMIFVDPDEARLARPRGYYRAFVRTAP